MRCPLAISVHCEQVRTIDAVESWSNNKSDNRMKANESAPFSFLGTALSTDATRAHIHNFLESPFLPRLVSSSSSSAHPRRQRPRKTIQIIFSLKYNKTFRHFSNKQLRNRNELRLHIFIEKSRRRLWDCASITPPCYDNIAIFS